jgi:hypothetical protein
MEREKMNTKPIVTRRMIGWLLLCLCSLAITARAQEARLQIGHLDRLAARATESVEITLNDVQMQFVRKLVSLSQSDQAKIKGLLAKLKGIYVRGFEFAQDGEYEEADLNVIRAQLRSPGWERIVEVRNRNSGSDEVFFLPQSDQIVGFAAISAEPRKLCVINIVGPLSMDDMTLLEKEFQLTRCGRFSSQRQRRSNR